MWRLSSVCAVIGVVLAGLQDQSAAQQREVAPALLDMARRHGTVRVLVHLDMATQPEGSLQSIIAILGQRQSISAAQKTTVDALAGKHHRIMQQFRTIPFVALEVSADTLPTLARTRGVLQVVEDHLSEPVLAQSGALVEAGQAWTAGFDGSDWAVAVLDTGVDSTHPMLAGKVVSEACYSASGHCPNGLVSQVGTGAAVPCTYDNGCAHGTHVAGIAAGHSASLSGVARGAQVIAMQVFSRLTGSSCQGTATCARSYTSDQIAALERVYALRGTYKIAAANMSLGGGSYTSQASCNASNAAIKAVIDNLRSVGIATVIASGNNGYANALSAPGCISSAVSVGATTESDQVASFSNSASFLSLLAPGAAITSAVPGGKFATWNGTSMAAPHVAGAWAILKQHAPTASVSTILEALQNTGRSITDPDNGVKKSRIRIASALTPGTPPPPPASPTQKLTVSPLGTGSGSINSTPAGLTCGSTCQAAFTQGQSVTLQATAASGSLFTGWSGAGCSGTGTCTVIMTKAQSVIARFAAAQQLTVASAGTGSGSISSTPAGIACDSTCQAAFVQGQSVNLKATAASGSKFTGWSGGGCSGTSTCRIRLSQATTVTATFAVLQPLTVARVGTGSGTVSSTPAGITCGTKCQATFVHDQSVTLKPTASRGSTFTGWSGAGCNGTGSCTVRMTQAQRVTATFSRN